MGQKAFHSRLPLHLDCFSLIAFHLARCFSMISWQNFKPSFGWQVAYITDAAGPVFTEPAAWEGGWNASHKGLQTAIRALRFEWPYSHPRYSLGLTL
jgi:hypothetical protein